MEPSVQINRRFNEVDFARVAVMAHLSVYTIRTRITEFLDHPASGVQNFIRHEPPEKKPLELSHGPLWPANREKPQPKATSVILANGAI